MSNVYNKDMKNISRVVSSIVRTKMYVHKRTPCVVTLNLYYGGITMSHIHLIKQLNFLSKGLGLEITFKDTSGFLNRMDNTIKHAFLPYNIHRNAYCYTIKSRNALPPSDYRKSLKIKAETYTLNPLFK